MKRVFKLGLSVLALIVIVSAALRIAAPYLISNGVVRSAIESSMAQWAGQAVTIDDVSELRFWPDPAVTLEGVKIRRPDDSFNEPFVEIPIVNAEFGLLSALKGRPDFNDLRFERPRVRIQRDADGRLDWSGNGLLDDAVRAAVEGQAAATNAEAQETEIGSVEIIDGEVTLVDAQSGLTIVAEGMNAKIDWPKLAAPLSGQATFSIADRSMSLSLQTASPLLLLGGAQSQIDIAATLPGLRLQVKGLADLDSMSLDQADIDLRVSDVSQASAAMGMRLAGTERWQTATLTTRLTHENEEWRFDNLAFDINGSRGDGILTLKKRDDAKPVLNGTLAVDLLNLEDLLQALSIDLDDRTNVRLPGITRWVDVDMRLSASTATFANFQLTNLGASLTGGQDTLKLVIGDTRLLGGRLSARFTGSGQGFDKGASIAIMMEQVDLGAVMSRVAPAGLSLKGVGSLTLNAQLTGPGWRRNIEAVSGSLSIRADNGEVIGLNVEGLQRLSRDRSYFQLSAAGAGSFAYRTLDMSFRFSEGSAEVETGRIVGAAETLFVSGIVPYSRQALALTGELKAADTGDQTADPLRFFIGGAWHDPVISPIPPLPAADQ